VAAGSRLRLVQPVDPVRAADLGSEQAPGPDLPHELDG